MDAGKQLRPCAFLSHASSPFVSRGPYVHTTLDKQHGRHTSSIPHVAPPRRRTVRHAQEQRPPTSSMMAPGPIPPLMPSGTPRAPQAISYGRLLEDAATAIESTSKGASTPSSLRLTVDFPPERSETRAGTLVSRFENNLNFMYSLAERLTSPDAEEPKRLGPPVEIRDNVNPQGGGEYLTDDECVMGVRLSPVSTTPSLQRPVTLLLNAGVDGSTLQQVQQYDEHEDGVVVLLNCALDRVSWFAKMGFAKYLESYEPAYYLKVIAAGGWLLKCGQAPWCVFVNSAEGPTLLEQMEDRPALVDVEAIVRLKLANIG